MSQRKRNGWFTKVVKVVASVTAFFTCTCHLVNIVDGAGKIQNINNPDPPSLQQQHISTQLDEDHRAGSSWSTVEESTNNVADGESFPLQKPAVDSSCDVFYLIVSTIDGKVSALDLQKKGSLVWAVEADERPLYSSSLANMEVIRNGKKMRLIPSLDGALYQFDGDKVEAIPVSAESLLSSTYKLGDDSMIVGSKDLRNFGVNLRTGQVQFACGSEGCRNYEGKAESVPLDGSNILVLTRSTQIVRSVDIKHGNEKWNFSVGQHQVSLPSSAGQPEVYDDDGDDKEEHSIPVFSSFSDECSEDESYTEDINYENLLQLLVPEGRVVALSKGDYSQVSWEHKFDSPIAKAWLLHHGKLEAMSLFDGRYIPTLRSYVPEDMENMSMPQPLLYIGSHQKLLYIQASPQLESILKTFTNRRIGHYIEPKVKVSWKPYLNTASTSAPIFGGSRPQIAQEQQSEKSKGARESTSLSVWHEDYPFDTGYFLYPEISDTRSTLQRNTMLVEDLRQKDEEAAWLPMFLLQYWKDVAIIVAVLVLVQFMLSTFLQPNKIPRTLSVEACAGDVSKNSNSSHAMIDSMSMYDEKVSNSGEYLSRFFTDFECLHCLGKGGFGIVFEAVNRVDDQHYAVKRTMLPSSKGAKEKVLREVRALAKLEHIGIVRYFNAWVESPPTDWQEERDKLFHFSDTSGPTSISTYTEHGRPAQKQLHPYSEVKEKRRRNSFGDQNKHPDSFLGGRGEALLETDSVIFSCQDAADVCQHKQQSGSGEFSVHTDFSETSGESKTDFTNPQKNLFSLKIDTLTDGDSASTNDSVSSIPFSNYTSSSSGVLSHKADRSFRKFSGDSVVFESTDNRLNHSSTACVETQNSAEDSIVFERSGKNLSKINSKSGLSLSNREHHTVDISLSHESEDADDDINPAEQVLLPGTTFFLYIQMQLYRKETLKDWLSNNTLNRDRHTVLDIFDQIVWAVDYVHSQGLMHRDLKPSNIFFTDDGIVKVGDFGLVTEFIVQQDEVSEIDHMKLGKHTAEVGTTLYMSPEQMARKPYDLKVDIFSLGLIFLELWIPFSTQMERIRTLQDAKIHIFPTRFDRELPAESELVHKMTNSDPAARPFTKEILDHQLLYEFAPSRIGTRQHKRTISDSSNR